MLGERVNCIEAVVGLVDILKRWLGRDGRSAKPSGDRGPEGFAPHEHERVLTRRDLTHDGQQEQASAMTSLDPTSGLTVLLALERARFLPQATEVRFALNVEWEEPQGDE